MVLTKVKNLQTLDRALDLIELINADKPAWTLTEFARTLDLHLSIVYRLANSLEKRGYLRRENANKQYSLGYKFFERVEVLNQQVDIRRIAFPVMQRIALRTGESVFLTVQDKNKYCICIEKIESQQSLVYTLRIGSNAPLHAGASAKILLAFLPKKIREDYLKGELEQVTSNTITDTEKLLKAINEIRAKGYAFSDGENNPGVFAVSVPIFNQDRNIIAGLSIGGPSMRYEEKKLPAFLDELNRGAAEISSNHGFPN